MITGRLSTEVEEVLAVVKQNFHGEFGNDIQGTRRDMQDKWKNLRKEFDNEIQLRDWI
jgi:hypothetical protein